MLANRDAKKEAEDRHSFYKYLEESKNNSIVEESADNYDNYFENQKRMNNARNVRYEYGRFLDSIDKFLLSEACIKIFEGVRGFQYTMDKKNVEKGKDMIRSYFNEANITDLKRSMRDQNTIFLHDLLEAVDYSHNKILEDTDKDNEKTFNISKEKVDDFYDHLDKESFDDATEMIKNRVSAAVQDFVTDNKADKEELNKLMNDTKDNIDSIETSSQEEATKIVEQTKAQYKRRANEVYDRQKSLYEEMVYKNYTDIMKDSVLTEAYSENGKLNIDSIVEFTEIQYTILEMFNTLKIDPVTEESVRELLS